MQVDFSQVEKILPHVLKPGRYIGGEKNQVIKNLENVKVRICFLFPDVYEIGMSNLGVQILYSTVNKIPEYYAERAFAPWRDFGDKLKEKKIPLYSLNRFSGTEPPRVKLNSNKINRFPGSKL